MPAQLLIVGLMIAGVIAGYVVARGFTAELTDYQPIIAGVRSRFSGTIFDTHDQLISAVERTPGTSVIGDDGHTVMVETVPVMRRGAVLGMFARAELRQIDGGQTTVDWTAMGKTPWASRRASKQRSLVRLEQSVRSEMALDCVASDVVT